MKFLGQFNRFDCDSFFRGKSLMVLSSSVWKDNEDDTKVLGTKLSVVIISDKTNYKRAEGDSSSNRFEKISVKVSKSVSVDENSYISLVNPTATIYGEYRNQLSVRCDDIKIIPTKQG